MTNLDNPLHGNGNGVESTAIERDRARQTVGHYATDTKDATLLLAILGLSDPPPHEAGICNMCGHTLSISAASKSGGVTCKGCRRKRRAGEAVR